MVVALDDIPPLLWHTELGQSIDSVWSGDRHRGAQLNRLDDALTVWTGKYHQLAFVRHFDGEITAAMEDAVLRVVAEYEGRPFPRTPHLVGKWLSGRLRHEASEQAVYCAELLAITYTRMGLLDARRRPTGSIPDGSGAATGSSSSEAHPRSEIAVTGSEAPPG